MADHPFVPRTLVLPGYVPPHLEVLSILGIFGIACSAVLGFMWFITARAKHLGTGDRLTACWFVVSGLIHMALEGYFAVDKDLIRRDPGNWFVDVWKEYGKGDSRYPSRDPVIVFIESWTAFVWGPLCWLVAYSILTNRSFRHPAQIVASVGVAYGTVVYYGADWLQEESHTRPEALYFWFYYWFMNSIWLVVPTILTVHSWRTISRAMGRPSKGRAKVH